MYDPLDDAVAKAKGTKLPVSLDDLTSRTRDFGFDITSTTRGKHNPGSAHGLGRAADIRTRDKSPEEIASLKQQLSDAGYKVLDEQRRLPGEAVWNGPHIHAEFGNEDPIDAAIRKAKTPQDPIEVAIGKAKASKVTPTSSPTDPNDHARQAKLANDIAWHFGDSVLSQLSTYPEDKQREIAKKATEYAVEDEKKKASGIPITESYEWKKRNQEQAGIAGDSIRDRAEMMKRAQGLDSPEKLMEQRKKAIALDNPILQSTGVMRWLKETSAVGTAGILEAGAGVVRALKKSGKRDNKPESSQPSRIESWLGTQANALREQAYEAESISPMGSKAKLASDIGSGVIEFAPVMLAPELGAESLLAKIGVGAATFGGYSGLQKAGRGGDSKEILKSTTTGAALGTLFGVPLPGKTVMRKMFSNLLIMEGGGTVINMATGLPLSEAATNALPLVVMRGFPELLKGLKVKTETGKRPATITDLNRIRTGAVEPSAIDPKVEAALRAGSEKAGISQTAIEGAIRPREIPVAPVAPEPVTGVSLKEKTPDSTGTTPTFEASVLGVDKFLQQDVAPVARGIVDTIKSTVRLLSPRTGVKTQATDLLMEMKGQRDKAQFILEESMKADKKMFDKLPTPDRVAFMDKIKTGQPQPTPELQRIADTYRRLDDEVYSEVTRYKPSLSYLENHFRVLWKVIPGSTGKSGLTGLFKRPLQGSRGFLKQHTLTTVTEGIQRGGVPVTTNPQALFEMHYADSMKFITAQRMWAGIKQAGLAKFVKLGRRVPDGFTRLSDPLAKVYFPTDKGLVNTGEWFVDEGAGRLLNNHLSHNYISESSLGSGMLSLKNHMTGLELGFSGFHAMFVASEGASSQLALGMRRFVNLGILKGSPKQAVLGLANMAKATYSYLPTSKIDTGTYASGARAVRYLTDKANFLQTTHGQSFIRSFPQADALLDDLFTGGGNLRMNEGYRVNSAQAWKEAVANGNYPGALLRSLPALSEQVMKPLFDIYIPRMKVGQFLQEYSLALQEKAPQLQSGEITRPQLARKTWDFVEDRFGEMNFDNLFWDNTFKSAMQLAWRSTTWKLGNLRATLGAVPEQVSSSYKDIKHGRTPMLEPKMAWLASQAIVTAALGTITMYMFTGKYPKTLTDLAFPQVDPHDPDKRLSVPTYVRDTSSMVHDPSNYIAGAASAEFSRSMEVWKNRDFKGQYVYDPSDPSYAKAAEIVSHYFPAPFSVSNYLDASKRGATTPEKVAGFFGFMKAPVWLSKPAWEQDMDKILFSHIPQGGRTKEAVENSQLKNTLKERRRNGDLDAMVEAYKAQREGKLSDKAVKEILHAPGVTPLQEKFKLLQLPDAERIYLTMSPDAQSEVLEILKTKRKNKGISVTGEETPTEGGT